MKNAWRAAVPDPMNIVRRLVPLIACALLSTGCVSGRLLTETYSHERTLSSELRTTSLPRDSERRTLTWSEEGGRLTLRMTEPELCRHEEELRVERIEVEERAGKGRLYDELVAEGLLFVTFAGLGAGNLATAEGRKDVATLALSVGSLGGAAVTAVIMVVQAAALRDRETRSVVRRSTPTRVIRCGEYAATGERVTIAWSTKTKETLTTDAGGYIRVEIPGGAVDARVTFGEHAIRIPLDGIAGGRSGDLTTRRLLHRAEGGGR